MMKQIFSASKIVALAVVLSFGLSYVYAWTAPTATPPTGNVSAPINTGDNTQYKAGNLVLNDSLLPFTNGLIVLNGKVGIGTASPAQKLSVAGTIESTSGGVKFPDGSVQATAATLPVKTNAIYLAQTKGSVKCNCNTSYCSNSCSGSITTSATCAAVAACSSCTSCGAATVYNNTLLGNLIQ